MSSKLVVVMAICFPLVYYQILPLLKYTVAVKNKGELCTLQRGKKQMHNGTYDIILSGRKRFRETYRNRI